MNDDRPKATAHRYLRATDKGSATRYGRPLQRIRSGHIIALTREEALRFKRGYDRQVQEGALEDVSADDHKAWQDKRTAEGRKAAAKAEAEAKAKAEAEAKAKAEAEAKAKAEAEAKAKAEAEAKAKAEAEAKAAEAKKTAEEAKKAAAEKAKAKAGKPDTQPDTKRGDS